MHRTIYVDESGDLGFGGAGSQYLVISFVSVPNKTRINRAVKRIKHALRIPNEQELKAYDLSWKERQKALGILAKVEMSIHAITVNKAKVVARLQKEPNVLYNYALHFPLLEHIKGVPLMGVRLLVDQRTSRVGSGDMLDHYLKIKCIAENSLDVDLSCCHMNSERCLGIQAADLVANTIARKYEKGHLKGYNMISGLIADERKLFF
jgi:hypothetical protein